MFPLLVDQNYKRYKNDLTKSFLYFFVCKKTKIFLPPFYFDMATNFILLCQYLLLSLFSIVQFTFLKTFYNMPFETKLFIATLFLKFWSCQLLKIVIFLSFFTVYSNINFSFTNYLNDPTLLNIDKSIFRPNVFGRWTIFLWHRFTIRSSYLFATWTLF